MISTPYFGIFPPPIPLPLRPASIVVLYASLSMQCELLYELGKLLSNVGFLGDRVSWTDLGSYSNPQLGLPAFFIASQAGLAA